MFFVKKISPPDSGFRADVERIMREVDEMSRARVAETYSNISTRCVSVKPYGPGLYIVYSEDLSESLRRKYIAPSMFNSYRSCARSLSLEILEVMKHGGKIYSVNSLRNVVRGLLVHKTYYEKYSRGETEVKVVSDRERICGVVDELRGSEGRYEVVEVKSGFNPDLVGAGLQVMSYMIAVSDTRGVPLDNVDGYIVSPGGVYKVFFNREVFEEYRKRLETVVRIALDNDMENLPPRLTENTEKCKSCSYRSPCKKLPDRYRSYERFFEAHGFKRLYEKKEKSKTLFSENS